jgi:hypothetical protein
MAPWCRARHGWNPAALLSSGRPGCVASPSSWRTQTECTTEKTVTIFGSNNDQR